MENIDAKSISPSADHNRKITKMGTKSTLLGPNESYMQPRNVIVHEDRATDA